ncbi:MAG: YiiX/YebB-like N1pC/P60 family cysteine hydrolase [Planctomycetota bacterium]|nr:YiiX/YebB-like N1pC/P60 family cysteine hydrolase [Planctomycetota bacterium]MDA1142267.1 YiiX/YebB-like N1pC/P60 family cysteine hydrolase [Planctomycetota bacterium]
MIKPARLRLICYGFPGLVLLAFVCTQTLIANSKLVGYSPREGDMVFQSAPENDLVTAIEGVTQSKYSHCGIVAKEGADWFVLEAIGPVTMTNLRDWIKRGRGAEYWVYRLTEPYTAKIPQVIAKAKAFAGKPYDTRYRMDDERIYCSELLYKAFKASTGEELGSPDRLGDLNWKPFVETIRKYEQGEPPLDRKIITPVGITRAAQLKLVFDSTK